MGCFTIILQPAYALPGADYFRRANGGQARIGKQGVPDGFHHKGTSALGWQEEERSEDGGPLKS
jgi:hypothetical protein